MSPTHCQQCGSDILPIQLFEELILDIRITILEYSKLSAVKMLMNKYEFSHADAKRIISHFNEKFGICHRCGYEHLKTENISCPKCKAYNYNCEVDNSFG